MNIICLGASKLNEYCYGFITLRFYPVLGHAKFKDFEDYPPSRSCHNFNSITF